MMGILSVTLGVLSVICCICTSFGGGGFYFMTLLLAVPAVLLGVMHLQQVRRGLATNRNLAIIGIVLGAIGLFIAICGGFSTLGGDIHNDID